MSDSEIGSNTGKIYELIPKIMGDLKPIGKDQKVQTGPARFNFRGIDDIYNSSQPLLAKYGVFTTHQILDEKRVQVTSSSGKVGVHCVTRYRFKFWASDGSFVETEAVGEGIDYGDKVANKCLSVAHKYAFLTTFAIPTKDNDDPDKETHDIVRQNQVDRGGNSGAYKGSGSTNSAQSSSGTATNVQAGSGSSDPALFVCDIGKKHKGKTIRQMADNNELVGFVNYLEKDGEPRGRAKEFCDMAHAFLNQGEDTSMPPEPEWAKEELPF